LIHVARNKCISSAHLVGAPNRNYAVDLDGGHSLLPRAAANASILLQLGPGDVLYAISGRRIRRGAFRVAR